MLKSPHLAKPIPQIVKALGEEPVFKAGDLVKISIRFPAGHYRVPTYVRGKRGRVEAALAGIRAETEKDGQLVNHITNMMLTPTAYSKMR